MYDRFNFDDSDFNGYTIWFAGMFVARTNELTGYSVFLAVWENW